MSIKTSLIFDRIIVDFMKNSQSVAKMQYDMIKDIFERIKKVEKQLDYWKKAHTTLQDQFIRYRKGNMK